MLLDVVCVCAVVSEAVCCVHASGCSVCVCVCVCGGGWVDEHACVCVCMGVTTIYFGPTVTGA